MTDTPLLTITVLVIPPVNFFAIVSCLLIWGGEDSISFCCTTALLVWGRVEASKGFVGVINVLSIEANS